MRFLPIMLVLSLFSIQAHAQSAPPPPVPAPSAATAPAAPPAAKPHAARTSHRMSWKQRFAAANTTHDGHLTLPQAEAGYITVARHFHEIDVDKKGYVTVEDITNWHKKESAARHSHQGQAKQHQQAMKQ